MIDLKIKEFLKLAALEQMSYDEISKRLEVSRKILTEWEKENKNEYKELAEVRKLYLCKEITDLTIKEFLERYSNQVRKCLYCDIWIKRSMLTIRIRSYEKLFKVDFEKNILTLRRILTTYSIKDNIFLHFRFQEVK